MAFVVPVLGAALGLGGLGQALIGAGLSLAMGAVARRMAPRPNERGGQNGMRLSLRAETNGAREVILGEAATAGSLIYFHTFGPAGNDVLDLVYAVADHECQSLQQIYVNGSPVTWNSSTGAVAEFPSVMTIKFYSGAANQAAASDLVSASGGRLTSADRGAGIAYVHCRLTYNQTLYPSGLPKFLFVIRGAKLYDIRKDSTAGGSGSHRWGQPSTYEWSANPVVQLYNYRRGIYAGSQRIAGMNTPAGALPASAWIAAANACDETVGRKDGSTEARYQSHGVVSTSTRHSEVIRDIVSAMAGHETDSGGAIRPSPGVTEAPVLSITDADLIADGDIEITGKRSRKDLLNAVFGSIHDPGQKYEVTALPPRISPDDEATDGAIRLEQHFALDLVTSQTQGQRVLEVLRRQARHQAEVKIRCRARMIVLEAGDWVTWTSDRYGYVSQLFEVIAATVDPSDMTVLLTLREVSNTIYAWTPATDELDAAQPQTVSTGQPTLTSVSGLAATAVTVQAAATISRPGIQATWTAITDPTVTAIDVEYRIQGTTIALSRRVENPSAGQYTWVDGVQGETIYEVRALPVTNPQRSTAWTGWVATATETAQHIVPVGAVEIAPGSVGETELDAQTRFEISLSTAVSLLQSTDGVQGSMRSEIEELRDLVQTLSQNHIRHQILTQNSRASIKREEQIRIDQDLSLASQITTVQANLNGVAASVTAEQTARSDGDAALAANISTLTAGLASANAAITTEQTARADGDSANASAITNLTTTVNGQSTTISQQATAINGISASYTIALSNNNVVTGMVRLDGTGSTSTVDILASAFRVSLNAAGGGIVTPFVVGMVNAVSQVGINGNLLVDGSIQARSLSVVSLSSITANIGTVTAGRMQSADGTCFFDLNDKVLQMTA